MNDVWRCCIAPRLFCTKDLVNLSMTCTYLSKLLKDNVNVVRIQTLHLKWTKKYFRAQHSMLQAWCRKLNYAFILEDREIWRIQSNLVRSRLSWRFVQEKSALCSKCGEALRKKNVKCFVSWVEKRCLCCAMETEYSFICNGSADEEEEENKFTFAVANSH
jgi:hypothetical protein